MSEFYVARAAKVTMRIAMFMMSTFGLLSVFACLPSRDGLPAPEAPRVLEIRPSIDVPIDREVEIVFSAPVVLASADPPLRIQRFDGRLVAVQATFLESGDGLLVSPVESWPAGETLDVRIDRGFVDTRGAPLVIPETPMSFTTQRGAASFDGVVVRAPRPGLRAPPNLAWVALAAPPDRSDARAILLVSAGHQLEARVEHRSSAGVLLARLAPNPAPNPAECRPLCPNEIYRVLLEGDDPGDFRIQAAVMTGTIADETAPSITSTHVKVYGDRVKIEVEASEPVVLRASASGTFGHAVSIETPLLPASSLLVEVGVALPADTSHVLTFVGEDLAGNAFDAFTVDVKAPRLVDATIRELVPSPLHDWSDSEASGVPFDARPGTGSVSDADEWVELRNDSAYAVDLRAAGIVLRALDMTPMETAIETAPRLYFGDGGALSEWWPGEALVVHPRGGMAQRGLVLELWSGERMLDRVRIGGTAEADHVGGRPPDALHESLARGYDDRLRWCVPTPGDPLPSSSCVE